jgi:hypothetical protein
MVVGYYSGGYLILILYTRVYDALEKGLHQQSGTGFFVVKAFDAKQSISVRTLPGLKCLGPVFLISIVEYSHFEKESRRFFGPPSISFCIAKS